MRHLEQSQQQKADGVCQGPRIWGRVFNGSEFQFGKKKRFCRWIVAMVHNTVNVLAATELYI